MLNKLTLNARPDHFGRSFDMLEKCWLQKVYYTFYSEWPQMATILMPTHKLIHFTVTVADTLKPGDSACLKIDINENWIEEFIKLKVNHSSIGILHKVETTYLDIKKEASFII